MTIKFFLASAKIQRAPIVISQTRTSEQIAKSAAIAIFLSEIGIELQMAQKKKHEMTTTIRKTSHDIVLTLTERR